METILKWLAENPYVLLFAVVAGGVTLGKAKVKGYGLGMVASAIIIGATISAWASTYGITMKFDNFVKSLFYFLFMYGVGLRTGPSFVNGLKRDGIKFVLLAIICALLGVTLAVSLTRWWDLPTGTAGGLLAGSMTMSAALGSAEEAVRQGVVTLKPGETAEQASSMIAIAYGLTYLWGALGIILICKYLPRWLGVDVHAAAKQYEAEYGVPNVDDAGLNGFRPLAVRAYRLQNEVLVGHSVREFQARFPQYKVMSVSRAGEKLRVEDGLGLHADDVVVLGGRLQAMTENLGLIGPEVAEEKALSIPIDAAEILVLNKSMEGKTLQYFQGKDYAGHLALHHIERGGAPIPAGLNTDLKRYDVLFVRGAPTAIDQMAADLGRIARPSTATDLLAWAIGMILGCLIGLISFPVAGSNVALGAGAGMLLSGILVSTAASRLRFFGNTPHAARNIIEELGLVIFISMVGVNAGASLISQLTPELTIKILAAGFVCTTIPPLIVWAIGYYGMKINAAVLMGAVAGARTNSGAAREAAKEIGSSVPWTGFPVGYAVASVLLTVSGYLAMAFSG